MSGTVTGVVLYGPPASGKDTATDALSRLDHRYELFRKLKVGDSSRTYRECTNEELDRLRASGALLYENRRYGNIYAVDLAEIVRVFERGRVPVVHMGQVAGVDALRRAPVGWLSVLLWCSRRAAESRLRDRGAVDLTERLRAWDETHADVAAARQDCFTIAVRTDHHPPEEVANVIHQQLCGTGSLDEQHVRSIDEILACS